MIDRRSYQQSVEQLLAQIHEETYALRRLKVAGVRGAALGDRKLDLQLNRKRLASLVNAGPLAA